MKKLSHMQKVAKAESRRQQKLSGRIAISVKLKSKGARILYKQHGKALGHIKIVRESKGINQPVNKYILPRKQKATHTINKDTWQIETKGRDFERFRCVTVHKMRILNPAF